MNTQQRLLKTTLAAASLTVLLAATLTASAQNMQSTNYGISWSAFDGGGKASVSNDYGLEGSVSQTTPLGTASSADFVTTNGFYAAPDSDADLVRDFMDNCTYDANPSQLDSNQDGFGNRCDADLDNNGVTNFIDLAMMPPAFLSTPGAVNWNPDADLNNDSVINFLDISLFPFFFLNPPGPSALAP